MIFFIIFSFLFFVISVILSNRINIEHIDLTNGLSNTGVTIAHLSDIHIRDNEHKRIDYILKKVDKIKPNIIVLTGDILDNLIHDDSLEYFSKRISKISPVIAIPGNHEEHYEDYDKWKEILIDNNIIVLENEHIVVDGILFLGLKSDTSLSNKFLDNIDFSNINKFLLLAHRPENFDFYCDSNFIVNPDLILSGHAHGGQFRLFGGGLYSPQQGIFPKYTSGIYSHPACKSKLVVSRGLGHCDIPIRFNNSFHIPVITIN